jgi:phosphoribosylaminoimidazole-succinocarboxamide synthase
MATKVMLQSEVSGLAPKRGKVRDMYDFGDGFVAIVATDRVSAFDRIMKTGIPQKGEILTALTLFWLEKLHAARPHHFVPMCCNAQGHADSPFHQKDLANRTMFCKKAVKVVPFECIVRGYLTGSAWESYQESGYVCGVKLPKGLKEFDRLEHPIFTPSTKAEEGHDQNISFDDVVGQIGYKWAELLRSRSLVIYNQAYQLAIGRGLIIVDTKFEFGVDENGDAMLIDEVLTPDSSRFILESDWNQRENAKPQSFDKQVLRDWLLAEISAGRWSKDSSGIELPENIVSETAMRYRQLYATLTGTEFPN